MMNGKQTTAMTALFCAMVAARKGRKSLGQFLRILPLSAQIKAMALQGFAAATLAGMSQT